MGDGLAQVARGQVDPVRGAHVVREVARQLPLEPLEVPLELRPHVRVDQPRGQAPPGSAAQPGGAWRSEEHTSELQSRLHLVCRLLLEKKKKNKKHTTTAK